MKQITAIVRPEKLEAVRQALDTAGAPGIMITEIEGHGKQKGIEQQWRGEKFRMELLPKMKIEVVVEDSSVNKIIQTIMKEAKTGEIGDGKIFVSTVENVIRIRSGEEGSKAI
mgnify:CR=1 FL=1